MQTKTRGAIRFPFAFAGITDIFKPDMKQPALEEWHRGWGAHWSAVSGERVVNDYGDWQAEYAFLRQSAGVLDLSYRTRLCLVGADRARFLHGQVTNEVSRLRSGEGCYAALTNAKGKMEADLNIVCLADELFLDAEPGLAAKITRRLEKYIVADEVQLVDVAGDYGLLSVQGPDARTVLRSAGGFGEFPARELAVIKAADTKGGEIFLVNHARLGNGGFDLLAPNQSLAALAERLRRAAAGAGGGLCGWQAWETARIEAGIPRFGADMDETTIPLEAGLEARAVSYTKGCYIGQEVINRIHSVGHVSRELRGLRLSEGELPQRGDKLFQDGKEAGLITSAVKSPALSVNVALGYIRREFGRAGTELTVRTAAGEGRARVADLPLA